MARTFRALVPYLGPAWLHAGEGGLKHTSWGDMLDANVARLRAGVTRRFPTYAAAADDDAALALIGANRGIIRGRNETAAHYAGRLQRWRYPRGHRTRGSAFALLEQIAEYWGFEDTGRLRTYDVGGNQFTRYLGAESATHGNTWGWDDSPATDWSRFWLAVSYPPGVGLSPSWGDSTLWGGTYGTPGYCIGLSGVTPDDISAMRELMRGTHPWRPAGTQPEWLIVSSGGTLTNPLAYGSDGFRYWSYDSAGVRTVARVTTTTRYVSLNPEHNNTYVGRQFWSTTVPIPMAGSQITGTATPEIQATEAVFGAYSSLGIDIYVGGDRGTATFMWGVDGGPMSNGPVTTAEWVDLGNGIVLHFEDGNYSSTAVWLFLGTFEGRPTVFPSSTTMPDGSSYAGDPSSFPTSVRLVDDGDMP